MLLAAGGGTKQFKEPDQKDEGSEERSHSVFVRGVTLYAEERISDGNKVLRTDRPPLTHTHRRPDERRKAHTRDCRTRRQESNRESRQKTLSRFWVSACVRGRLVPQASSSPTNPSWELYSPSYHHSHLFLLLSFALPQSQKHPLHGS